MEQTKKTSFVAGAAILAFAGVLCKIIGVFIRIWAYDIIGEAGMVYYEVVFPFYSWLLIISSSGVPTAISRMVSERFSTGDFAGARRVFRRALILLAVVGLVTTAVLYFGASFFANSVLGKDDSYILSFTSLAPALFFVSCMCAYRGYLQGAQHMTGTGLSQLTEQVIKCVVGLMLAARWISRGPEYGAAGLLLGITVSEFVALLVVMAFRIRNRRLYMPIDASRTPADDRPVIPELLRIAIPITLGSAGLQLLTMLETKIYMGRLLEFYTQAAADTMRGIYGMTQTIFNMPCAFITPITISIIPAITAQLTTCNDLEAKATEESAIRITGLISMPCAFGLGLLAQPVTALLGGYTGDNLVLATRLMSILGFSIMFNAIVLVTTAIMQAHGHATRPVLNMLIGGVLKLAAVFLLTGNPNIGIVGTPVGTLLCYIAIAVLNISSIRSLLDHPPAILKNLIRTFLAAVIMGIFVFAAFTGLKMIGITSRLILCGLPIAVGVAAYAIAAVKIKVVTREDCLLLPKGEKIARLLKL